MLPGPPWHSPGASPLSNTPNVDTAQHHLAVRRDVIKVIVGRYGVDSAGWCARPADDGMRRSHDGACRGEGDKEPHGHPDSSSRGSLSTVSDSTVLCEAVTRQWGRGRGLQWPRGPSPSKHGPKTAPLHSSQGTRQNATACAGTIDGAPQSATLNSI